MPAYSGSADVAIYAVYSGRRLVPVKVRAFVDHLVGIFGPEPYWDREIPAPAPRLAIRANGEALAV
jgi:hypothetical protein